MPDQPNIVLIMTDQQRADFFASEGFALDTMPFVEAMGAEGVSIPPRLHADADLRTGTL